MNEIIVPIRILIQHEFEPQDILDFIYDFVIDPDDAESLGIFNILADAIRKLLAAGFLPDQISDFAFEYIEGLKLFAFEYIKGLKL